jgi:hypothetical protein
MACGGSKWYQKRKQINKLNILINKEMEMFQGQILNNLFLA